MQWLALPLIAVIGNDSNEYYIEYNFWLGHDSTTLCDSTRLDSRPLWLVTWLDSSTDLSDSWLDSDSTLMTRDSTRLGTRPKWLVNSSAQQYYRSRVTIQTPPVAEICNIPQSTWNTTTPFKNPFVASNGIVTNTLPAHEYYLIMNVWLVWIKLQKDIHFNVCYLVSHFRCFWHFTFAVAKLLRW